MHRWTRTPHSPRTLRVKEATSPAVEFPSLEQLYVPPSPARTAVKFSTASLPPSAVMRVSSLGFLQLRVVALAVSSRHKHRTTRGSPSVTFSEPSGKPDILYHAIMGQSSADDGEGRAEPHHSVSRAYIVRTHVPTKSRPTFLSLSLCVCVCVCPDERYLLDTLDAEWAMPTPSAASSSSSRHILRGRPPVRSALSSGSLSLSHCSLAPRVRQNSECG